MATRKAKNEFDLMGVVMALGGGVAGGLVMDTLEDKIDFFKDKPMLSPLVVSGAGLGAIYFGGERFAPVGYGMMGAAGAELMEMTREKMNGFSRVSYKRTPGMQGWTLNDAELDDLDEMTDEGDAMSVDY